MDLDELDQLDPVEAVDLSTEERPFGIVVYGATGYTGCLMTEHLDALLSQPGATPMKWAIAGRDLTKLRRIARRCKTKPEVMQVKEPVQVSSMAGQARCVVAAAGPYSVCGEDVIMQCVNQVTHYIDVSGEVVWIHSMIQKYHEKAKERGVMIVHCAGAVCAPDELICYLLVKKLGPLKQFREYFLQFGAMSGGTFNTSIASMAMMTREALQIQNDPFALGGDRDCGLREVDQDCIQADPDPLFPGIFLMPAYNSIPGSRIVRRSCKLFEDLPSEGVAYGKGFSVTIRDCHLNKKAAEAKVAESAPVPSVEAAKATADAMRIMQDRGEQPRPGEGPPPETREIYSTEVYGVAEAESGEWAHVHYSSGEAYEVTAMACIAGAMVLVEELSLVKPKERGGIITPAFAFHGSTWIDRMTQTSFACKGGSSKIIVEVKDGKPEPGEILQAVKERNKKSLAGMGRVMGGELKNWTEPALTM
uniref:Saccharopine dehydrogenase NADP binding domain-containing protein n=1 Tax=Pyrodinium bahamense TaxID=73915 RepID=A0A7S0AA36_9DINO